MLTPPSAGCVWCSLWQEERRASQLSGVMDEALGHDRFSETLTETEVVGKGGRPATTQRYARTMALDVSLGSPISAKTSTPTRGGLTARTAGMATARTPKAAAATGRIPPTTTRSPKMAPATTPKAAATTRSATPKRGHN